MSRKVGELRLALNEDGKIKMELYNDYSSIFHRFARSQDPNFFVPHTDTKEYPSITVETSRDVSSEAHFVVRKRKGKHSFAFGFDYNQTVTMTTVLANLFHGDRSISKEDQLKSVFEKRSDIYETDPDLVSGERMFVIVKNSRDKPNWGLNFTNNQIIAHKGSKKK